MAVDTVSTRILTDIADAIRGQNGLSTRYAPGDMATAILTLTWDTGVKVRAMLLTDGTLEFNYRDGRSSDLGTIVQCWEVNPAGYTSDSARPWHAVRQQVTRVVFDSDFSGAGMTNFAHWCRGMGRMTEGGALEIGSARTPDAERALVATGRICANARYVAVNCTPWHDDRASLRTCKFKADLSVPIASMDYLDPFLPLLRRSISSRNMPAMTLLPLREAKMLSSISPL